MKTYFEKNGFVRTISKNKIYGNEDYTENRSYRNGGDGLPYTR